MKRNKPNSKCCIIEAEEISKFQKKVRSEFFFKFIIQIIIISFITTVNIIHLSYIAELTLLPDSQISIATKQYILNPTINWIFFSSSLFLIIYFLRRAFFKVTPSIVELVEKEINNLGLKLEKKYRTEIVFLILNGIAALFMLIVDFGIIHFETIQSSLTFQAIFIGFLSLSVILPIGLTLFQNKFSVKLKDDYSVSMKVDYPIIPRKNKPQLIDIYFASNALSLKSNRGKFDVYKKISEKRWLMKSKVNSDKRYALNPFIFFKGYSTPLEFQDGLMNVALAIKEWDEWEDCEKLMKEKLSQEMQIERQRIIYTICLEMRFNRN